MATQNIHDIGARISALRRERDMTQDELAARLCITAQAVSKWERGVGLPDVTMFPALAEALGTTVGALFGESAPPEDELPVSFEELTLVARHGALGCYSNKKMICSDEDGVTFADGSRVEYATRTVNNCGAGEIRLVENEQVCVSEARSTRTEYKASFAPFRSLSMGLGYICDAKIVPSCDGQYRVYAKGSPRFISLIEASLAGEMLSVQVKSSAMGGARERDNELTVEVGFERGEVLEATISGSGSFQNEICFASGRLAVNGSGDITARDFGELTVGISGSGDVTVGNVAGQAALSVNGSGDVSGGAFGGPLHMDIAGSGDVRVARGRDVAVRIGGSGDVTIDRAEGQMCAVISGSGDIRCGGEVTRLDLSVAGSGDFDARRLTAHEADIQLSGASSAHVGRIVGRSTERIEKFAKLRVDHRGE